MKKIQHLITGKKNVHFSEEESEEEHKFFAKDYMTNSSFENSS